MKHFVSGLTKSGKGAEWNTFIAFCNDWIQKARQNYFRVIGRVCNARSKFDCKRELECLSKNP